MGGLHGQFDGAVQERSVLRLHGYDRIGKQFCDDRQGQVQRLRPEHFGRYGEDRGEASCAGGSDIRCGTDVRRDVWGRGWD
ncbi:hypothetical protein D3C71_1640320 [compost metagenome]